MLPHYCKMGVEGQVAHLASADSQMERPLVTAGQEWELWLPCGPPSLKRLEHLITDVHVVSTDTVERGEGLTATLYKIKVLASYLVSLTSSLWRSWVPHFSMVTVEVKALHSTFASRGGNGTIFSLRVWLG